MGKSIRPIRIEGNTAYVPLTQGLEAVIDIESIPLVEGVNWHAAASRCKRTKRVLTYYAHSSNNGNGILLMHRLITQAKKGEQVDHIDGNGLNNITANMRIASVRENQWNQRLSRANTSGYKGVCWNQKKKKWRAKIKHCKKTYYLGDFKNIEDAAAAYAKASAELHGEFGRLR